MGKGYMFGRQDSLGHPDMALVINEFCALPSVDKGDCLFMNLYSDTLIL